MADLFADELPPGAAPEAVSPHAPLADRLRPQSLDEVVGQARNEAVRHIRLVEEEAREEADRRAKRVITVAIERLASIRA